MKKILLIIFLFLLTSLSCGSFQNKERVFVTTSAASFTEWLGMRIREGSYPEIRQGDASSITGKVDFELVNSPSKQARATWIGHATMLVQYQGINFLTDPHLTERPAPVDFLIPKRLVPAAIPFDQMPTIDFIVISHNHYDHLDHRTVEMFANSVMWYVPLGLKEWFIDQGIGSDKVVELDWWQSHKFNEKVHVTFTPNVHWSKRTPWDTNKSLWGGWSVKIGDFNSWFGGDTAYDEKIFKEIGQRTGPYQMAFIPIGAYKPRSFMLKQHVDPFQAIQIHKDINSKRSIPIHWGTFQLTHEPFLEPVTLLKEEMLKAELPLQQFEPIKIGETVLLDKLEKFSN